MLSFVARRVIATALVLLAATFLTFLVGYLAPGDPARSVLGTSADPEALSRLQREYGLDKGFWAQYGAYLLRVGRLDFGYSHRYHGIRVGTLLKPTILVSARLALFALAGSLLAGVALGCLCAVRQGTPLDRFLVVAVSFFNGIPLFVLAFLLLYLVSPRSGDPCLPVIALGIYPTCFFLRLTRSVMGEVLEQDFIRTARAHGVPPASIVFKHALLNALPPVLASAGTSLGALMTGTFFVERIFRVPGMAGFAVESVLARDYPVMLAVTLLFAAVFSIANLLADVACAAVDPRIRGRG